MLILLSYIFYYCRDSQFENNYFQFENRIIEIKSGVYSSELAIPDMQLIWLE